MKKLIQNTCAIIFLGLLSSSIHAQGLNCRIVQQFGNEPRINATILEQINRSAAGSTYNGLTKLKKLEIKEIESIHFEGCKAIAVVRVVLHRKVRRNAKGRATITGEVVSANNLLGSSGRRSVCISNAKVEKLKLSNTLRFGEKFYAWVANKVFPKNQCYEWYD